MSSSAIEISQLGKRYRLGQAPAQPLLRDRIAHFFRKNSHSPGSASGEFWALEDVSLTIPHGQVLGIIGRNGAGKSTLLKILSRITEPTVGRVRIRGRVASLLEVGTGFHPELTGRENIFLNGAILGMSRAEIRRKFDEIVAFSEVERFLETPVKHYSSGMYVRLAFAVAAHLEPEILIVDEVLAVGDAAFQKKCLGKMRAVAAGEGRTVLFVSHNMGAVRGLCSRVAWLERGRLRSVGETAPLLNEYLKDAEGNTALSVSLETDRDLSGKQFYLTRLTINAGEPVIHGEPLTVEFEYATRAAVDEASIGVGFSTLEGIRLMSLDSDFAGQRHPIAAGQRGKVKLTLPAMHLQPGTYLVDAGARSGDYFGLDYTAGATRIEILPGPSTPASIIRPDGGVRVPALWSGFPV